MLKLILDFLFPKSCVFCGTQNSYCCLNCRASKFVYYNEQICHVCKQKVQDGFVHEPCLAETNLDGVVVAVHYNNAVKVLVEELKYNFVFSIAEEIAEVMRQALEKSGLEPESAIPVPLHRFKKNYRGFNQAELLAQKVFGKKRVVDCLKRKRNTKTQVGMNREQRLKNLQQVFALKFPINFKTVVLVDDVMTTGTTLEECAVVLKQAGVGRVYALVFARD